MSEKIWTILEMIQWGTGYFGEKSIDSPRLTIELLLCAALNVSRLQLYANFDRPLGRSELDTMREFVKRRAKREPLQYIVGSTEFYGLPFAVNSSTLIPRPETELLVEKVLTLWKESGKEAGRIADIGTGSGCIALSLAKYLPSVTISAFDVSETALETARANAAALGIENVEFVKMDILQEKPSEIFDAVVSNPPYISREETAELAPELWNFEPKIALTDGQDGLTFYRRFGEIFAEILSNDGFFCVEIGFGQEESVRGIFQEKSFEVSSFLDYAKISRGIVGKKLG